MLINIPKLSDEGILYFLLWSELAASSIPFFHLIFQGEINTVDVQSLNFGPLDRLDFILEFTLLLFFFLSYALHIFYLYFIDFE